MKNNFSDSIANEMLKKMASQENVSLFRKDYVIAEDENDAKKVEESSSEEDSSEADKDCSEECSEECCDKDEDDSDADDVSLALDTAVASLLSASAALDAVGFEKSASLSLKLASFVVEAKKKGDDKKKAKKKKEEDSKGSKKSKDSKKSDSKDSKKSDSKKSDTKKPNPFAKKK